MILSNEVVVHATPHEVFQLVNDVERVVTCLPGASIRGRDGDGYLGGVKVKVGPVSAAYTGSVRFTEVDPDALRMRLQARGTDTRGSGDAEAQVDVTVEEDAGGGARLRLETDLVIRGKIAQFGKGAIKAVSDKLLQQFAVNLGALLEEQRVGSGAEVVGGAAALGGSRGAGGTAAVGGSPDAGRAPEIGGPRDVGGTPKVGGSPEVRAPAAYTRPAPVAAPAPAPAPGGELDGLALLLGPTAKYVPLAGAFLCGLAQGWLLAKVSTQSRQLKELRRG